MGLRYHRLVVFRFEAELWEYQGEAPWVFVTVPLDMADDIEKARTVKKPFGSIRVAVSTGGIDWETSLFPDGEEGTYVLPVKKQVRTAVGLDIGDSAVFEITLV